MGKKVGILNFHWAKNFGAVLQSWALNKLLIDMGYEAEIINFLPKLALVHSRNLKPSELAKKYRTIGYPLVRSACFAVGEVINYVYDLKNEIHKNRSFDHFRKHFLRVSTKAVNNIDELRQECLKYDLCIVGSDQVWNPEYLSYSDFAYLLPFRLEGVKKIAFSASIAKDIPSTMIKLYEKALSDFSFISCREKTHCRLLKSLLGKEVYNTLDPTLLLSRESYETIIKKNTQLHYEKYVLVYNFGFSILPLAEKVASTLKLPVIVYNNKPPLLTITRRLTFSKYFKTAPSFSSESPREFLTLLKNAEFVITNSFHGTALSLLYEKPFISVLEGQSFKQKSRIIDLLELFELKNRIFVPGKILVREIIREPIDYDHFRELLNDARRYSLELLTIALKV